MPRRQRKHRHRLIEVEEQTPMPQVKAFPLSHIGATVEIIGTIATLKLEHIYVNKCEKPLKTKFIFPVDYEAAVGSLKITSNGKTFKARITEREKARTRFEEAVKKGDSAYLLEYDKNQEDLLEMQIGNILPGKTVVINIQITMKLEVVAGGCLALRLAPTFVPRSKASDAFQHQQKSTNKTTYIQEDPYQWKVGVNLIANGEIQEIYLPSHQMKTTYSENKQEANLTMASDVDPNQDFLLFYRSKNMFKPRIYIQPPPKGKFVGKVAAMVSYVPQFLLDDKQKLDVQELSQKIKMKISN